MATYDQMPDGLTLVEGDDLTNYTLTEVIEKLALTTDDLSQAVKDYGLILAENIQPIEEQKEKSKASVNKKAIKEKKKDQKKTSKIPEDKASNKMEANKTTKAFFKEFSDSFKRQVNPLANLFFGQVKVLAKPFEEFTGKTVQEFLASTKEVAKDKEKQRKKKKAEKKKKEIEDKKDKLKSKTTTTQSKKTDSKTTESKASASKKPEPNTASKSDSVFKKEFGSVFTRQVNPLADFIFGQFGAITKPLEELTGKSTLDLIQSTKKVLDARKEKKSKKVAKTPEEKTEKAIVPVNSTTQTIHNLKNEKHSTHAPINSKDTVVNSSKEFLDVSNSNIVNKSDNSIANNFSSVSNLKNVTNSYSDVKKSVQHFFNNSRALSFVAPTQVDPKIVENRTTEKILNESHTVKPHVIESSVPQQAIKVELEQQKPLTVTNTLEKDSRVDRIRSRDRVEKTIRDRYETTIREPYAGEPKLVKEKKFESKFIDRKIEKLNTLVPENRNREVAPTVINRFPKLPLLGSQKEPSIAPTLVGDIFKDTVISTRKVSPKRNSILSNGGVIGAGLVFLGDTFQASIEKNKPESKTSITNVMGGTGKIANMAKTVLPMVGALAPAIIGTTVALALKRKDFKEGFTSIKEGKVLQGLETIVIGSRDSVDETKGGQPIKETAKQSLAYGSGALGIGASASAIGTIGAITSAGGAVTAGTLGSAVMTGLASALPPALIAMAVAGTAKGIQSAWVNGWDTKSEEIVNATKAVLSDENATLLVKSKAVAGTFFKGVFGTLAGGLRETVEGARERIKESKAIVDSDDSLGKKVLDFFKLWNPSDLLKDTFSDFGNGFSKTALSWFKQILPENAYLVLDSAINVVRNIFEQTSKLNQLIRKTTRSLIGTVGNVLVDAGKSIGGVVKNGVISALSFITSTDLYKDTVSVLGNIGDFFTETYSYISENVKSFIGAGFSKATEIYEKASEFLGEKIGSVKDTITESEWFQKIVSVVEKITGFFGELGDSIADKFKFVTDKVGDGTDIVKDKAKAGVGFVKDKASSGLDVAKNWLSNSALTPEEQEKRTVLINTFGRDKVIKMEADSNESFFAPDSKELLTTERGRDIITNMVLNLDPEMRDQFWERFGEVNPSKVTRVNDAIITSDGQVIHTHQDDNIIATKNEPNFIKEEVNSKPKAKQPQSTDLKEILGQVQELVKVLKDKQFQNIAVGQGGQGSNSSDLLLQTQLLRGAY